MQFTPTALAGLYLVDLAPSHDERGFFARTYAEQDFSAQGLTPVHRQCSISFNTRRGTLRGLHYQAAPFEEHKLVRVTAGSIFDVAVDLRAASPTCRHWYGTELSAVNRRALYIPAGFAHGFVTLENDTEVLYMISTDYAAGHARGVRWDDPAIGIDWPLVPAVISARDAGFAHLEPAPT
jgi:dTDP-4-dehydrorhamnose 3,5-epimerase